jgi:ribose 5-phosphate isomerase B
MKIAIGADHRGFEYKEYIKKNLVLDFQHSPAQAGFARESTPGDLRFIDIGAFTSQRSDYPEYAIAVAELVASGAADCGIVICGSGIGMAVAANRYQGVYAGILWNEVVARFAREHDNINIASIPSDFVSDKQAVSILQAWLTSRFLGGRYQKRIDMIDAIK